MIDQSECPLEFQCLPKTNKCDGCYFKKDGMVCIKNSYLDGIFFCVKERRKDKQDIIFVKIKG